MSERAETPRRRSAEAQVVELSAAQEEFFGREVWYRDLLNALPAAIYTTDAEGRITFYNEAAVQFAGRRPALGDMWCVTWKLFHLDGSPLPHDECPMAVALKEGRAVRGAEAIAERPDGSRVAFAPYPTPLYDQAGAVVGAVNMLVDITDRKNAEERQELLTNEVNHRANNLLSVVQSIVRLTRSDDVDSLRDSINGRIQALARAHSLLAKSRWLGADLQRLVSEELAPYMGEEARAWVSGTMLPLRPSAAQSVALIVHELVTNAAKYGALSNSGGRVQIEWRRGKEDILIRWREEGGPEVSPPDRRGVGSTVIERAAAQLEGRVTYGWASSGLIFEFRAPVATMVLSETDGSVRPTD
ncbi:sensor histidine kinase [Phenylobacterium sp.]|uniref:sensor histidine kinase n=1 Tax=Phenylobacterium sp. TaxID=1871053 RepID=UPI002DEC5798|nr:HWE histidine kinase domain-containing protein [Phenylobacterium sp.]